DINKHFGKFKDHEVIQLARKMNSEQMLNISNDRVIGFAVACDITDGHVILTEENAAALEENWRMFGMTFWPKATALEFAKLLDDFYVKSRFREFFVSQKELYDRYEERFFDLVRFFDFHWFDEFYGMKHGERFKVYLLITGEDGGYGAMLPRKDGTKDYYGIVGLSPRYINDYGEPFYVEGMVRNCMLLYNLYYAESLLEKHYPLFKKTSERLYPHVADRIGKVVGSDMMNAKNMVQCYIMYAAFAEYSKAHDCGDSLAGLDGIEKYGFVWFGKMQEAVERYLNERDKYPAFDDFMPEIAEVQNTVVTDEFLRNMRRAKASAKVDVK
ncbi:MAG: DUF4932 domain-containing protein, partial [Planctomycetaceae bacterium]|nr:DUF4932 domain-containing protein [Planctomycetaceae bacterium]